MKKSLKQLLIVFSSSILFACAATPEDESASLADPVSRGSDCISEGTIRDYRVLDDSNLLVSGLARRKYHIELVHRTPGLRSSWSIGFSSPTSRICPGFSELLVDDTFGPERVRIASIRLLNEEQLEDLLYRYEKAAADKQKPPAPEPVEGAEVEELD